MQTISYCITVANEKKEFINLINFLLTHKRVDDNILILVDSNKCDNKLEDYLLDICKGKKILAYFGNFKNDFSEWKNKFFDIELFNLSLQDYLFFIDADELPNPELIENLPYILEVNPEVDVFGLPRINFVEGIPNEYIQQMGWNKDQNNRINYPDTQWRICKNSPKLRWKGNVHETIVGYKLRISLPQNDVYDLLHMKTFEKQKQQNELYSKL